MTHHHGSRRKHASLEQEIELGVDFGRQVGVSRVEGRLIITEFEDREAPESPGSRAARARICIKRNIHGKCLMWIEAPE
ncbi:hypothetical protein [Streptomyces sp. NPDC090445]|uniref:hypothetical protein n=1 Tax=Streptomyces sp. NPDC090445 TaxID=3365963 RepID=UPI003826164D